ncbi:HNH endonuclease [Candidatus Saccharibacteria bacterium]|nr:HNH endonuclease [Candidatus Saccharibacteria bacterium]
MKLRLRRIVVVGVFLAGVAAWLFINPESYEEIITNVKNTGAEGVSEFIEGAREKLTGESDLDESSSSSGITGSSEGGEIVGSEQFAKDVLEKLEVKGRAPKTGYSREEFYDGWPNVDGCSLRQRILKRELGYSARLEGCNVVAGEYDEPYTGEHVVLASREEVSKIQIDHVVALSDAWQKGAQYKDYETRNKIATDPLNLLAVDGAANKQKSDGDAATWLPKNKKFRCQYVARQISVKYKYSMWVTQAEKEAMARVLSNCPEERAIGIMTIQ